VSRRAKLSFPELERHPVGRPGVAFVGGGAPFDRRHPGLDDCIASKARDWLLVMWEPLHTKAPGPSRASPYCCYLRTVIFYHSPHIVSPWVTFYRDNRGALKRGSDGGRSFVQWDEIETRLNWDDAVEFEGEVFRIGGGSVVWAAKRWWMRRQARRIDRHEFNAAVAFARQEAGAGPRLVAW
jgi:hypothetical protein